LVATAANRIHMDPLGHINLKGFSIASHFFAQFLRKVGVRFDAVAVGRYKSAPDALTADAPRQEDREVFGTIVQAADAALGDSLQRDRGCSQAAVEHALAVGLMGAADAQRAGLIDALVPSADLAAARNSHRARRWHHRCAAGAWPPAGHGGRCRPCGGPA
jgi:protease-4